MSLYNGLYATLTSLGCFTRFYHSYYVTKASNPSACRVFYDELPSPFMHLFETVFVEASLCSWIENQMAFGQYVIISTSNLNY